MDGGMALLIITITRNRGGRTKEKPGWPTTNDLGFGGGHATEDRTRLLGGREVHQQGFQPVTRPRRQARTGRRAARRRRRPRVLILRDQKGGLGVGKSRKRREKGHSTRVRTHRNGTDKGGRTA